MAAVGCIGDPASVSDGETKDAPNRYNSLSSAFHCDKDCLQCDICYIGKSGIVDTWNHDETVVFKIRYSIKQIFHVGASHQQSMSFLTLSLINSTQHVKSFGLSANNGRVLGIYISSR